VDSGPSGVAAFNFAYVTVTICAPGSTTNCQNIDHVKVDTGSIGLRIVSSVLSTTLAAALPQEIDPALQSSPIAECAAPTYNIPNLVVWWGPVKHADVSISGETASNVAIQVIGDPAYPDVPCPSALTREDTVQTLGANGVLGVGPFAYDCGADCTSSGTKTGIYYACLDGTCTGTTVPLIEQMTNPVAQLATDNNGVIVELPAVPDVGAATASGALVFGIGTQSNNGLGNATVLAADASLGSILIDYKSDMYLTGFINSGLSQNLIYDSSINVCASGAVAGSYCPPTPLSLSATLEDINGAQQTTVSFAIANATTQFADNPAFTAFNNLAKTGAQGEFHFGLPFFFGHNVFVAIDGKTTPGGITGPYIAF
jgi:hypothetical protein